ncbi:RNA polymerase-associated protein RapA [Clostridium saccharobutylicum]|uniref:DEAD/DEAH box helicase n=1 Tax=Clostridium saccharobutylicum TaxID=169679 RepID=UPI000983C048|nr:DEAD/DEAH box helicase [Clostridium saccharobutylicum]AQS10286.1 RNA polymerase-associated protein RapA [Clostridium saccharobutylicum]NSB87684.1 non-specific serine/threonine protein kinase [Clostridium saccharobutylicum]NYC31220.1 non-specific serine/threonine protein kinase [Clostridium saccharobutylicum]OOM17437.1 RNA polymerase-associated protein RapA [Clostridium saccharobutylicum]
MEQSFKEKKELTVIFTQTGFAVDYEIAAKKKLSQENQKNQEDWYRKFLEDKYKALWDFGFTKQDDWMSQSISFLYFLANKLIMKLSKQSDIEFTREEAELFLDYDEFEEIKNRVPFAIGMEFINDEWISLIWEKIADVYRREISIYKGTVKDFLIERNTSINVVGRVFFHLVENKEEDYPFAFLATYSTENKNAGLHKAKHMPLKNALLEYKDDKEKLLQLMSTISKAADKSDFISDLMESGELFSPLKFTKNEAYTILKEIPIYEESGILCRIPNWWRKKSNSLKLSVSIGEKEPSKVGMDALLSFEPEILFGEEKISKEELKKLLLESEGLALIKGKWIEIDKDKLSHVLEAYEKADSLSKNDGLTIAEAMRMELNAGEKLGINEEVVDLEVSNGAWLKKIRETMSNPEIIKESKLNGSFNATLRPYQQTGFSWLSYMQNLGFGACLADDMGLGKTVQIIAFLEKVRVEKGGKALLIIPASLIGNWQKEIEKFAPEMTVSILHGKESTIDVEEKENIFLYITTYGMATRLEKIKDIFWDILILDEAQAIKNPGTKQTKIIKQINAKTKIAMTGTPIENRLSDLWSLFDFLDAGLLGNAKEFTKFTKRIRENNSDYAKLRNIVNPFILRRLKTDKSVISDLPEKIEIKEYASLSKKQIVLYTKLVKELEAKLQNSEGIERKGLVLGSIIKFKQICNHPDQYLGLEEYKCDYSGKFEQLKDICENIYEKRERVLVFTQFKEMTQPISDFLEKIFNRKGLVLHGGTSVKNRSEMVESFNGEEYIPYMVLSLKAGGVGLNLTSANHVIHFDRWWNPAVENQATDRAFRIGQTKNVMVHKFVTAGTIEEKIDLMIEEKQKLAHDIIASSGENWITELDNNKLMELFKLGGEK